MRSRARTFVVATMLVSAVAWIGCGEKGPEVNEAAEAEYAVLQEAEQALAEARQQLAELRAEAEKVVDEAEDAITAEGEPDEGEGEGEAEGEGEGEGEPSLEQRIAATEREVLEAADAFNQKIGTFFNEVDPMLEGEEPSERQAAVLRMKSGEDMIIANEYIDRGGDYRRAIRIYEDALVLDPDNEDLKAALAKANEMRFMTEERLEQVKNGMTQGEVKALLGAVNLRNIRDYPERNVVAWFYPVDDTGAASAVWFRKNRAGELAVYKTEFEQIKGRDETGAEVSE